MGLSWRPLSLAITAKIRITRAIRGSPAGS
jgi:hypothetical protein